MTEWMPVLNKLMQILLIQVLHSSLLKHDARIKAGNPEITNTNIQTYSF